MKDFDAIAKKYSILGCAAEVAECPDNILIVFSHNNGDYNDINIDGPGKTVRHLISEINNLTQCHYILNYVENDDDNPCIGLKKKSDSHKNGRECIDCPIRYTSCPVTGFIDYEDICQCVWKRRSNGLKET